MFRSAIISLALAPGVALAGGDAVSLSCAIVRSCDVSGVCANNGEPVDFRFTPRKVNRQGEGVYQLETGDIKTAAYFISETGPVIWSRTNSDVQTMAFTGERTLVWVDTDFGTAQQSKTHFLKCEES